MRLHELFEALDQYGVYAKPAPDRGKIDGTQSPLTYQGDKSWLDNKDNIYTWFKRPYLTNGPEPPDDKDKKC